MKDKQSSRPFAEDGKRLRLARVRSGRSLGDFAAQIGKTRQTLGAWENGRSQVDPLLRPAIAGLLGADTGEIWPRDMARNVPRETSEAAPRPFAEHVLVTAGRIIQLAEGMARDATEQIALAETLARRSELEFERKPTTPVTRVSGAVKGKKGA